MGLVRLVHRRERAMSRWLARAASLGPLLAASAGAVLAACGGAQNRLGPVFMQEWEDDGGRSIRAVQTELTAQRAPIGAAVAVGATASEVVGVPLAGGEGWRFSHKLASRPAVSGTVVVGEGGGEMFALDALTGRKLWTRPASGHLRGIGDDGRTTVVSLTGTGDNESTILAVDHRGKVVRQIEAKPAVGVPAILGSYLFLPWENEYVTVYDLARGGEIARATFREQVSRAFTEDGGLFFGERGLFRFDDQIGGASANRASHVDLPVRELPGNPQWFRPGSEIVAVASDARDRVELFGRVTPEGEMSIDSDRFVATYFRVALGLDAHHGKLAWARTNDADFIGGAPFAGGVALCDAKGRVRLFDVHTGAEAGSRSLGKDVASCIVQADGFALPTGAAENRPPLADQIAAAIEVDAPELATIQQVLLHELARLPEEVGTKVLIELSSNPRTSPLLLPDARDELAERRTGPELMVRALERHYDFLKDVLAPPPVGPLADALAAMKWTSGADALASHLDDPADSTDDVKRVAAALDKIGGPAQADRLAKFFAAYRAAPDDENIVSALGSAADALLRFGTDEQKALVRAAAADTMTADAVRNELEHRVGDRGTPAGGSEKATTAASTTKSAGGRPQATPR